MLYVFGSGYMGNSHKLRLLRLLRVGLRLRIKFGEKRVGRRPFLSNKLSVCLDIGLILDGLQNCLLLRHLCCSGARELRHGVLHVQSAPAPPAATLRRPPPDPPLP